jgi:subtilisin family serine protease
VSGVRVAVIDSGVHARHPHVEGVAGGIAFDAQGCRHDDFVDRLGHGTAVTAAIREKAPRAEIHALKVFDRELRAEIAPLLGALDWAIAERVPLVNLSLGVPGGRHEEALRDRVRRATAAGVLVVTARTSSQGEALLPGALPGVLPVEIDWSCPRDEVRVLSSDDGSWFCRASGYPRPAPGVPPERNLKGVSFAVANVTGCLARLLPGGRPMRLEEARRLLTREG